MGFRLGFFAGILILISSCAQMGQLDGGPVDDVAPRPDSLGMKPPFASTNISPRSIEIDFDEYIQLNNPQKNIIIIPTITPQPTYKIKGKKFFISFADSSLKPNTTYAIYMNGAIKDITEGNDSLMNYVFSTGSQIDSLTHEVYVKNAFTNLPVEDVMVGLYPVNDTVDPYKQIPTYFSKTDQFGIASFNYMSQGTFRVFAFKNSAGFMRPNLNDPIAFKIDDLILDTIAKKDTLFLFGKEVNKLRLTKKDISLPGKILVVATRSLEDATITVEKDSIATNFTRVNTERKDSVFLWFKGEPNTSYNLKVNWIDTSLSARLFLKKSALIANRYNTNIKDGFVGRYDSLKIISALPITSFDTTKWTLLNEDSVQINCNVSTYSENSLAITNEWEDEENYVLTIEPGGITDFYGEVNKDSLSLKWQRKPIYKLSNMIVNLKSRPEIPLIVQVISSSTVIQEKTLNESDTLVEFNLLEPGDYIIRVILDENNNKKWDTGNYDELKQPERVLWFRDPIKLRPNWDSKVALRF